MQKKDDKAGNKAKKNTFFHFSLAMFHQIDFGPSVITRTKHSIILLIEPNHRIQSNDWVRLSSVIEHNRTIIKKVLVVEPDQTSIEFD